MRDNNITIFGLYNIPWIVKTAEYGKSVKIIGPKKRLFATCEPASKNNDVMRMVRKLDILL